MVQQFETDILQVSKGPVIKYVYWGVEGIPKFYHKIPPPQKRRKIFNTPLKGD
jgi:hypothetical protein